MPRTWKYIFVFLAAAVLLVFLATFSLTDTRLHLVFCDVGQGDAILAYRGSTQVLIDGGPDSSVLGCLSRHMPFWDRKIELVVLTHPDADHYAGLVDVVRRYQIVSFAGSVVGKDSAGVRTLGEEIEKRGIRGIVVNGGQRMAVGDVELGVVWPSRDYLASQGLTPSGLSLRVEDLRSWESGSKTRSSGSVQDRVLSSVAVSGSANEYSVVLHLKYGEFDALLTGDIVPPVTDVVAQLIARERGLKSASTFEVIKVPHHGSKNGLTESLLGEVKPKLAVISVGKNSYGHPHQEVIKLLSNPPAGRAGRAIKLLRTDEDGEVEVITDGKRWDVRSRR